MKKKFKILSKETLFKSYFKIDRYKVEYQKFEGGWSNPIYREVFERGNAVAVLPYDPIRKEVVLIEQFRIGAIDCQSSPWLLEVVAGIIEKNESAEDVAKRETLEEAGLKVNTLHSIYQYWASPGGCTEQIHLYCGIVDTTTHLGEICGLEEEEENIKVHIVNQEIAFKWLQENKIKNATALVALQWLELNHQQLLS